MNVGRIFNFEILLPWEFNTTSPIRSIFFPALTVGVPYGAVSLANPYLKAWWGLNLLHPYVLVAIPRLSMTLFSFISDYFIYRTCLNQNTRPWSTLRIWASSHVVLVFLSRTFSNSIELVLFSSLLYLVASSMKLTDRFVQREVQLEDQYKKATNAMERVNIVRMQKKIPMHKYNHSAWIGAVFALGLFNRPTFVLYALVPIFFWMQRGMFLKKVGLAEIHLRMSSLVPTFLVTSLVLILADTFFYYNSGYPTSSYKNISDLSLSRDVVITPLNFLVYNMDRANLAGHGLHPWYLHSAVNVPLLFNILGIGGLYLISRAFFLLASSPWSAKPDLFNFNGLLVFSFAFPLIALSFTPHQEPRFLLPLLVPLVLLLGPFIVRRQGTIARLMRSLWYAGNAVCVLFYGFFHQGGVYDAQHFLHRHIHQGRAAATQTHLLYFHTYMPPLSLLAVPHRSQVVVEERGMNGTTKRYRRGQSVFIEDLAGAPYDELMRRCARLVAEAHSKYQAKKMKTEIFVIFPATISSGVEQLLQPFPLLSWRQVHQSFPHLSMEDPPDFGDLCTKSPGPTSEIKCHSLLSWLQSKFSQLALVVYQLKFEMQQR